MINLFETFDNKTQDLYNSLLLSGVTNETIILEDNGYLPQNIITPYRYFSETQYSNEISSEYLYFNEIKLPEFWEIEGNNDFAYIKNMNEIKGRIIYNKEIGKRAVQCVEWLDDNGKIKLIDYYDKNGVRFSKVLVDDNGKLILKKYYNSSNEEIIYENFVTKDFILKWKCKEFYFHTKKDFILFFLKELKVENDSFLINSLSIPLGVIFNMEGPGIDCLFWQERINEELPFNMKEFIKRNNRSCKIIVPNNEEYKNLVSLVDNNMKENIVELGYNYEFRKKNKFTSNILTLTNTDQIPHLEKIIKSNSNALFHIVAVTEMSNILKKLDKYNNVRLFPNAKHEDIKTLFGKCDIYLDINQGGELLDAVKKAFEYNLLILGYAETAHNKDLIANKCLFQINNYKELIITLNKILTNRSIFKSNLKNQMNSSNHIDGKEIKKCMQGRMLNK